MLYSRKDNSRGGQDRAESCPDCRRARAPVRRSRRRPPPHITPARSFFGDSLTDNGNLYRADQRVRPGPAGAALLRGPLLERPGLGGPHRRRFRRQGLHTKNYAYAYGEAVTNVDTQFGGCRFRTSRRRSTTSRRRAPRPARRPAGRHALDRARTTFSPPWRAAPPGAGPAMAAAANAVAGGIESLARDRDQGLRRLQHGAGGEDAAASWRSGRPIGAQQLAAIGVDTFNATLDGAAGRFRRRHPHLEDRYP